MRVNEPQREVSLLRKLEKRQRTGMARFAFFIYRFNGPIVGRLFRKPRNVWQIEQGVISMLAGDLFDSPKVVRRLPAFKFVYAMTALRHFVRWRAEHRIACNRPGCIHRRHHASRSQVKSIADVTAWQSSTPDE